MPTRAAADGDLQLTVAAFTDADHWRWVLKDAQGAFLADHTVALDPGRAEYAALDDLHGYLERYADDQRWLDDQARLMDSLGRWLTDSLLGPIGAKILEHGTPAVVRVRVPPAADRLLYLPLEAAQVGGRALPAHGVSFVYTVEGEAPGVNLQPVGDRLRVLAVFSLPTDASPLALRRERHALKRLIRRVAVTHRLGIEVRVLQYGVTRRALADHVEQGGGWDVLHFSGHGLPASLILEHANGTADRVPSETLVELLEPTRGRLKLVTLSACLSAAPVEDTLRQLGLDASANGSPHRSDAPSSDEPTELPPTVARALVRGLDCAVLAMRFPIVDDFAIKLAAGVYERLLGQGQPLPRALQLGLRAALPTRPTLEAPPMSVATPALFGRAAADLRLAPPRATSSGFVVAETGFAYFPREPERFVGRVGTLSRARQALAVESERTGVLFVGMAGAGKTACALELAYSYEAGRFDGFVFHKAPDEGTDITDALLRLALDMEKQLPDFAMAHVVDRAADLRDWLPRLTELLEQRSILLVLDNLESLLAPDGTWRDERWGWLLAALLDHGGWSRTVLTSRIRPRGLDPRQVLVEPIHALSLDESVVLARELPNLGRMLRSDGSPATRAMVVRTLNEAQGHPKLLELADGQASDPSHLAAQLEQVEAAATEDQSTRDLFLRERTSRLGPEQYLAKLASWTRLVTSALREDARTLFHVLCALEESDRDSQVLDANWADIWRRLGRQGEPPAWPPLIQHLAEVALIEIEPLTQTDAQYRLHPGVAEAGRTEAGVPLQESVDIELVAFWEQTYGVARDQEQQGQGGLVVLSARRAVPYLIRREEWGSVSMLMEQLVLRDGSPTTLAWALPLQRQVVAATRRTADELRHVGMLARVLHKAGRWQEAEMLLRDLVDRVAASGEADVESAGLDELIKLLEGTGRLRHALALVDQHAAATRRAGLGPWTQLASESQRLGLRLRLGEHAAVLSAVAELRQQMAALPEQGESPERVRPWSVREVILDIGRRAALELAQWDLVLALNAEVVASQEARGASVLDVAMRRYNDYGALLRLGRPADAGAVLEWCRTVFERAQDVYGLQLAFSGLAEMEAMLGHYPQAVAFEQTSLRYTYAVADPDDCASSHNNLGAFLKQADLGRPVAVAHQVAAGVIRLQTGSGRLRRALRNLAIDIADIAPARPPFPATFDELCQLVEQTEGVRFRELFARLPKHAATGDEALQTVIAMAEDLARHADDEPSEMDTAVAAEAEGGA